MPMMKGDYELDREFERGRKNPIARRGVMRRNGIIHRGKPNPFTIPNVIVSMKTSMQFLGGVKKNAMKSANEGWQQRDRRGKNIGS